MNYLRGACLMMAAIFMNDSGWCQGTMPEMQLSDIVHRLATEGTIEEPIRLSGVHISVSDMGGMKQLASFVKTQYPTLVEKNGSLRFGRALEFDHCTFDDIDFSGINFGDLAFTYCRINDFQLHNCLVGNLQFENNTVSNSVEVGDSHLTAVHLKSNYVDYEVYLEKDSIEGGDLSLESNRIDKGELVLSGLDVRGSVTIGDNSVLGILLEKSHINLPEYGQFNNYKLPGNDASDLYLTGNEFKGDSSSTVVFNKGNYLNLDIRENHFYTNVYFVENHVNERFFLVQNTFDKHVSFEKFLFSEIWNELYWDQLSGYKLRYVDYAGQSIEELNDVVSFKNLINIYKGMHTIFLSRGDLESANGCYAEMKQMQGRMLYHIYVTKGGFRNFLRWQLNVLLKIYTDHGTDPGLAVVMSFFVILAFGVLYLFFPSEWDSDSLKRMLVSYEQFLQRQGRVKVIPFLVVMGSVLLTLVNALTLSINSFVTLGFGSIPTHGFARYLCIIEGFIGWFLLSIFTVALINQVLA